jgi:hypothetical protein
MLPSEYYWLPPGVDPLKDKIVRVQMHGYVRGVLYGVNRILADAQYAPVDENDRLYLFMHGTFILSGDDFLNLAFKSWLDFSNGWVLDHFVFLGGDSPNRHVPPALVTLRPASLLEILQQPSVY